MFATSIISTCFLNKRTIADSSTNLKINLSISFYRKKWLHLNVYQCICHEQIQNLGKFSNLHKTNIKLSDFLA